MDSSSAPPRSTAAQTNTPIPATPTTGTPRSLLDLPNELLLQIIFYIEGDTHKHLSLAFSCRRLHSLARPISRKADHALTSLGHHRAAGKPYLVCVNNEVRELLDRPHDRVSRRWCVLCYAHRAPNTFRAFKAGENRKGLAAMVCNRHLSEFVLDSIPLPSNRDPYSIVDKLMRKHTDVHYIEISAKMCLHCRHSYELECKCRCVHCDLLSLPAYILPDKSADTRSPIEQHGVRISHGGYSDGDREADLGRRMIGSPSAASVVRSGKTMVPVIEVQTWEWPGRRYVLVLWLEERGNA